CPDTQSRNRRFGLALGKGKDVETAQEDIGHVVEGYRTPKEVCMLSQRMGVEMPIVDQIYQVLYQGKDARLAAQDLLARDKKAEGK
ncbi:glycerol-3-phosphate dehydrogenase, partial [Escherichia coli]|nr:glycerol-3-phosphate dehydrogenase [Escherichia coli]